MNQKEFMDAIKVLAEKEKAIKPKELKSSYRRNLKPMVNQMKQDSISTKISDMISVTTAKKRTGDLGAKVGVVKNDKAKFPKFSAPALASVLEYGTEERFRKLKGFFGIVTGRQSTGRVTAKPYLRPAFDTHVRGFMDGVVGWINKKLGD